MIEDTAIMLILLMGGVPTLLGLIYVILTRPSKYYYKLSGGRVRKIRIRDGKER